MPNVQDTIEYMPSIRKTSEPLDETSTNLKKVIIEWVPSHDSNVESSNLVHLLKGQDMEK